ncbi:DUF4113 domain-containing protein [Formosa sediminum]|uniref:DUF4113 domain-containing protein n=1 Tax=Formosa sediminum TaxID=2594004 RepID=A0A516GVI1_9FLAO|nr:DUF4113 domain-containing protein [Formosa sediminum]
MAIVDRLNTSYGNNKVKFGAQSPRPPMENERRTLISQIFYTYQ